MMVPLKQTKEDALINDSDEKKENSCIYIVCKIPYFIVSSY